MAKPTQTAAWATDANYTGGPEAGTPTKVEPTAAKKAEGHEPGEEPAAQSLNWWQNVVGAWTAWLNGIVAGASPQLVQMTAVGDLVASNTLTSDLTINNVTVTGDVQASDYNHTVERRASLPLVHNAASQNIGNTTNIPYNIGSVAIPFYFESAELGIIGLREGDRVTKVRLRFSGNGTASTVNLTVKHYRYDTGEATTSNNSTAVAGYIEVVPGAGKNQLDVHDTMLDRMWVQVSGSEIGIVIEGIDVFWTHPA